MLNEKLTNALEHPKSTKQGIAALVAGVALAVFTFFTDGFGPDTLAEMSGVAVLLFGAGQRIFFAKDKR